MSRESITVCDQCGKQIEEEAFKCKCHPGRDFCTETCRFWYHPIEEPMNSIKCVCSHLKSEHSIFGVCARCGCKVYHLTEVIE